MTHNLPSSVALALRLDGLGGAEAIQPGSELPAAPCWLHLDYSSPQVYQWLEATPLLPEPVRDSLQGESNRPKLVKINGGMLLTLRGVNHLQGQQPDQMVALRLYITETLIVSTRRRPVWAVEAIANALARGEGPLNTADWLVALCEHLTEQAGDFIDDLQEQIAALEEQLLEAHPIKRSELATIRRQLIVLRRYLAPQRDFFIRLANEKVGWLEADDLRHFQEIADRLGRWLEDLDASIARAAVLAEEINARLAEAMTRRTYIMSLMAMVFLPASFLASLFGVNLGGIPGSASKWGFVTFCSLMLGLIVGLAVWLRHRRWL